MRRRAAVEVLSGDVPDGHSERPGCPFIALHHTYFLFN